MGVRRVRFREVVGDALSENRRKIEVDDVSPIEFFFFTKHLLIFGSHDFLL